MTRRKKWDPERMKAANEAMRNKEMGSYKASRFFSLPQTTLQSCVKDRESSSEAIKQKWVRSKFFLVKEKMIWLSTIFWWKESFWVWQRQADVVCLAYQLAVRNGMKNQFCTRIEKTRRQWLKNFIRRHQEISVTTPEGLHSQERRGSLLNQ